MSARNINTCYVCPIDCGPARDFPRSVIVCVIRVSTSHAEKLCLDFSVSLVDTSALATGERGVSCVNELAGTPARLALYRINPCNWPNDQLCRLRRCFLLALYPYAFEILHGDTAFGALSSTHYLFRNLMVHITSEPLFFSSAPAHQPLGGLSN